MKITSSTPSLFYLRNNINSDVELLMQSKKLKKKFLEARCTCLKYFPESLSNVLTLMSALKHSTAGKIHRSSNPLLTASADPSPTAKRCVLQIVCYVIASIVLPLLGFFISPRLAVLLHDSLGLSAPLSSQFPISSKTKMVKSGISQYYQNVQTYAKKHHTAFAYSAFAIGLERIFYQLNNPSATLINLTNKSTLPIPNGLLPTNPPNRVLLERSTHSFVTLLSELNLFNRTFAASFFVSLVAIGIYAKHRPYPKARVSSAISPSAALGQAQEASRANTISQLDSSQPPGQGVPGSSSNQATSKSSLTIDPNAEPVNTTEDTLDPKVKTSVRVIVTSPNGSDKVSVHNLDELSSTPVVSPKPRGPNSVPSISGSTPTLRSILKKDILPAEEPSKESNLADAVVSGDQSSEVSSVSSDEPNPPKVYSHELVPDLAQAANAEIDQAEFQREWQEKLNGMKTRRRSHSEPSVLPSSPTKEASPTKIGSPTTVQTTTPPPVRFHIRADLAEQLNAQINSDQFKAEWQDKVTAMEKRRHSEPSVTTDNPSNKAQTPLLQELQDQIFSRLQRRAHLYSEEELRACVENLIVAKALSPQNPEDFRVQEKTPSPPLPDPVRFKKPKVANQRQRSNNKLLTNMNFNVPVGSALPPTGKKKKPTALDPQALAALARKALEEEGEYAC